MDAAQVDAWFPWSREEFAAAGQAGAGFAEQLATVDPEAEEFADYRARVAERTVSGRAARGPPKRWG